MSHRMVAEVMATDVATVAEDTPFKEIATVMAARQISALPVLDRQGQVAGVVSEADLIPKQEAQEAWDAKRLPRRRRRAMRDRACGLTARDVMTAPAIAIGPHRSVVAAARSMDRNKVARLPVLDAGRLVGIISRQDLVRVFLRPDTDIAREIMTNIFEHELRTNPALVRVTVTGGVVTLAGEVEQKSMIALAVRMARSVDGVIRVNDRLRFVTDDTHRPYASDPTRHERSSWRGANGHDRSRER